MGDGRTYDYVVALRAADQRDFMTADWGRTAIRVAEKVPAASSRAHQPRNHDVSSKPPATIEWE